MAIISTIVDYPLGQQIRVSVTFQQNAVDFDPTNVFFRFGKKSTASPTSYTYGVDAELVKDSVGNYYVDMLPSSSGVWEYVWSSTGNHISVEVGRVDIISPSI